MGKGQRQAGAPLSHPDIEVVQGGGLDVDKHFACGGDGFRDIQLGKLRNITVGHDSSCDHNYLLGNNFLLRFEGRFGYHERTHNFRVKFAHEIYAFPLHQCNIVERRVYINQVVLARGQKQGLLSREYRDVNT